MNVNTLDHKCKQYKCKNVCTGTFIRYLGINIELTKLSLDNSKSGLHTHIRTPVAAEAGGQGGGQVAPPPLKDVGGQTCLFATPSEASGRVKKTQRFHDQIPNPTY